MRKQIILLTSVCFFVLIICGVASAAYPSNLHVESSGNELNNYNHLNPQKNSTITVIKNSTPNVVSKSLNSSKKISSLSNEKSKVYLYKNTVNWI